MLRRIWPEEQTRKLAELSRDLDAALRMPGYQMAIAPPIRTRIDMLTTGVRTPVGIKVFGENLNEIERISIALEGLLRQVPGTRSTFAERQTGREYVDIVPNREAIARYNLTVRDVHDVVEAAIGGMPVSTAIAGRARFSINLRFAADRRADPEALGALLVPVPSSPSVAEWESGGSGVGGSPGMEALVGSRPATDGGMGTMGSASGGSGAGSSMSASGMSSGAQAPFMAVPRRDRIGPSVGGNRARPCRSRNWQTCASRPALR
jgi:copper/silver efflux system protein